MATRRYTMTRRADQAARTRAQIITAALVLYRERGIPTTSIQAVGRRSGVSPATVLNHFGSADALAQAVVAEITRSLRVPDDREWTDVHSYNARVHRLVSEMFAFYDRSTPWFELFRNDMGTVPALREGQRRFWDAIQQLYGRTLGSALKHKRLRGAVFGLTSPATLGALRGAGLSLEQASDLIGDVLLARLKSRGNKDKGGLS